MADAVIEPKSMPGEVGTELNSREALIGVPGASCSVYKPNTPDF